MLDAHASLCSISLRLLRLRAVLDEMCSELFGNLPNDFSFAAFAAQIHLMDAFILGTQYLAIKLSSWHLLLADKDHDSVAVDGCMLLPIGNHFHLISSSGHDKLLVRAEMP